MSMPYRQEGHDYPLQGWQQVPTYAQPFQPPSQVPYQDTNPPPLYTAVGNLSIEDQRNIPGSYPTSTRSFPSNSSDRQRYQPAPENAQARRPSPAASKGKQRAPNEAPSIPDDHNGLEKIHIAVMGVTGAGKSKFIQLCTESKAVKVGHGLRSCTNEVGEHDFVYRDKQICLIDTPGFDDTSRTDREVLDDIATWLGTMYAQKVELAGILYLHRVTDPRMGGVAFDNLKMFKKLCGDDFFPRVFLTTTMWDIVDKKTAEKREAELLEEDDFWRKMHRGGCNIERHWGDRQSAMDILGAVVRNQRKRNAPTFMQVQREMVDEGRNLDDTAAGKEVNAKIEQERIKFQKELERARREMQEALEEHDERAAAQYKKQQEALQLKLQQGYDDQEKMKVKLEDMQRQQVEQLRTLERELEESRAEYRAVRIELDEQREQLRNAVPGSHRALMLEDQIAEQEAAASEATVEIAKQEEIVQKKKNKLVNRVYAWIKENPGTVAKGGMIFMQFANNAAAAFRRRKDGTIMNDRMVGHGEGMPSLWDSARPSYEVEEIDEDQNPGHTVGSTHTANQRGSFLDS